MKTSSARRDIYYWKCDRPAAFHGTEEQRAVPPEMAAQLRAALAAHFDGGAVSVRPAAGQGNHLTWEADVEGVAMFVRVENGPEHDAQLAIESALLDRVRAAGVSTPRVHGVDVSRATVPFAWQALERIEFPDLNRWQREGRLEGEKIAFEIGAAVARWQAMQPVSFGPISEAAASLAGCHERYADYFHLHLDRHLDFLVTHRFLSDAERNEITAAIAEHAALLELGDACLVHKDLALWNVLGSPDHIAAFIDFDDAIGGDPLDDLSLLACFHDRAFLERAFTGYTSVRALPPEHRRRFWLHLLRNMIVKAVIRVGAGYFTRGRSFFLNASGGASLEQFTHARLRLALRGVQTDADLSLL